MMESMSLASTIKSCRAASKTRSPRTNATTFLTGYVCVSVRMCACTCSECASRLSCRVRIFLQLLSCVAACMPSCVREWMPFGRTYIQDCMCISCVCVLSFVCAYLRACAHVLMSIGTRYGVHMTTSKLRVGS